MKKSVKYIVTRVVCCVVMVALIVGMSVGTSIAMFWEMQLDRILCPPITDSEAVAAAAKEGQKLAKQVVTEGSVLLENKNDVLPLSKETDKKVNIFGYQSVDWMCGAQASGSSGRVMLENSKSELIDFTKALTRYGISYNSRIQDIYKQWKEPVLVVKNPNQGTLGLKEMPMDLFSQEDLRAAEQYSQTAFVILSRTTAEGVDADVTQSKEGPGLARDTSRHMLELSTEEEALLTYVGNSYQKVIVILNSPLPMECGFMEEIEGLDALVHVGQTGTQAVSGLPALLYGDESFSGRLADTWAYDITKYTPVGAQENNWFTAASASLPNGGGGIRTVEYVEGIYVGYKWYETADKEGVWTNVSNSYGTGYNGVVQYPFGYGLSYATFSWKVKNVTPAAGSQITEVDQNTRISIDVEVTNTSEKYAGREVVEAYVTVPYYKGGVEKSYVSLVGFAKTGVLMPQASETVTVEIDVEDFLSYDCYDKNENGFKGWELEHSDEEQKYEIKLMKNSHELNTVDFDTATDKRTGAEGIIEYEVPEDITCPNDFYTGVKVQNLFTGDSAVDGASLDGSDGETDIPFMSRADFDADYTLPDRNITKNRTLSAKEAANYDYTVERAKAWDNATGTDAFGDPIHTEPVKWGVDKGLRIADGVQGGEIFELGYKLGADYNAPEWEDVLNQVSISEAATMLGPCVSGNNPLNSVGKPHLSSLDSINQIGGFTSGDKGTGNPNPVILAQTFNKDLMHRFGLAFGQDMNSLNIQSVYGPGANLHRSPRGGRNFEYYSEDTYLTSVACCMVVRGIQDRGCSVELKHLAVNEVEGNRGRLCTYLSEQAFRETYLRPFQRVIEEENCSGLMTAYSNVGTIWAGGSSALLTGVLRREWGFHGVMDTDWTSTDRGFAYGGIAEQLRAGGDLGMGFGLNAVDTSISYDTTAPARLQYQMREAVHHVLYAWLSSRYQETQYVPAEGETNISGFTIDSWKWWRYLLVVLDSAVVIGCVAWSLVLFLPKDKNRGKAKMTKSDNTEGKNV